MSATGRGFKPSNQILRFARLIETLAGHEFDPLRTSEVAKALGISASDANRLLNNGVAAGWIEQAADGRWRLASKKITNIAVAVQHGCQRARARLEDDITNYTRSAY